ncbi:MAG: hypothetical protein QNJ61_09270 [Desulfobacterales bacterium]|nr:hypothetical protein [Desulfobacterales bacterium]
MATATPTKMIIDLERLNRLNHEGCAACGHKFNLGDPVVMACGAWEGGPRMIHEYEAVLDPQSGSYVEKRCYSTQRGRIG